MLFNKLKFILFCYIEITCTYSLVRYLHVNVLYVFEITDCCAHTVAMEVYFNNSNISVPRDAHFHEKTLIQGVGFS